MENEIALLSVIIPVKDEAECVRDTILSLDKHLQDNEIPFEIVAVDDHSSDETWSIFPQALHGR